MTREAYVGRMIFEDTEAKTVGQVTVRLQTVAACNANIMAVLSNAAIATAMSGSLVHTEENDSFLAELRCHEPNGDIYIVAFTRNRITVSSFQDDLIRTKVET